MDFDESPTKKDTTMGDNDAQNSGVSSGQQLEINPKDVIEGVNPSDNESTDLSTDVKRKDSLHTDSDSADDSALESKKTKEHTSSKGCVGFSSFLFGNVNNEGELEEMNLFDQDVIGHLKKLSALGAVNFGEVVSEEDLQPGDDDDYNTDKVDDGNEKQISSDHVDKKILEDLGDPDDVEPCEVSEEEEKRHRESTIAAIMRQKAEAEAAADSSDQLEPADIIERRKIKLDTPLAAMLPSKYADVEITDLFPEFRRNKVLRFSRIFGPGKPSSQPRIWKGVKFRKRHRKRSEHTLNSSVSASTQNNSTEPSEEASKAVNEILPLDQIVDTDDEDKLQKPRQLKEYIKRNLSDPREKKPKVALWRYGPARFWYDMAGVPDSGEGFDYGFKLKPPSPPRTLPEEDETEKAPIDDPEAFLMINQLEWEKSVIWNGDDVKSDVLSVLQAKCHPAGWIPSGHNRTASSFTQHQQTKSNKNDALPTQQLGKDKKNKDRKKDLTTNNPHPSTSNDAGKQDEWYSIFPVENQDLVYGLWEDDIIWDSENMTKIPQPKLVTIDPNDDNLILTIPDDSLKSSRPGSSIQPATKEKKDAARRSKMLLGKVGFIAEPDPVSPEPEEPTEKDPFNISNDEYYVSKAAASTSHKTSLGVSTLIQHSLPALELRQPYFPTYLSYTRLRSFHRPVLKKYSHGTIANSLPHGVNPLIKHIKRKEKQREQERQAAGGGEIFFMRTAEDLSGKDGDLVLAEYSEEHPPLVSMVGMAAVIKNYYKRKPGKDPGPPEFAYGETVHVHTSPFLGTLAAGQSQQSLECQLFRAPIYHHEVPDTDFLIIRTRDAYFIREVNSIFLVGQELPLTEVPGPNSKKANNFIRDFLQVFIYRLFFRSRDNPKRIKMEDIKKAFPLHSESSIRKRLKMCADFKRTGQGSDSNWWVLKQDFRLPTEDEIRAMVSPEQCCAYYSMLAAEQRLTDAGYGEKSFLGVDDDNDEDIQMKMEDEVKAAPWNTTRAFIAARKGKCLLQLQGVADPTGCGEGFSYVRVPNKPQINKEEQVKEQQPKKTVTGTDADLRRLPLNQARQMLRNFGVPEDQIKKLTRWEVIDVVRTLSTEQAKAGEDTMSKFARGNRFSIAEHQERYKEECQRIFDLQNRILNSNEILSTDESESDAEEDLSDIEEMGKNIESMLNSKKTSEQLSFEQEEAERQELRRLFVDEDSQQGGISKRKKDADKRDAGEEDDIMPIASHASSNRILKIYRTYRQDDGKEFSRIETVRKPAVIDTYLKIRQTKDQEFIRRFATTLDEQQKESLRKDKRRLLEQLRRIKRTKEKSKLDETYGPSGSKDYSSHQNMSEGRKKKREKKEKEVKESKVRCSACGEVGHMKSNRICRMYNATHSEDSQNPVQVAMTDEQLMNDEMSLLNNDELVKVDETKIVLSKHLFTQMDEMKRKSLVLKVPREAIKQKRRRIGASDHCDYLQTPGYKKTNRQRTDPLVTLASLLEAIINEMRDVPDATWFWNPVNPKQVTDYYNIIKNPIDLLTMRKKCRDKTYKCRADFVRDCQLIVENSAIYNGKLSPITETAKTMKELADKRLAEKEDKFARLEKAINPLLDDDDQVAFSYILDTIVQKLKAIPDSRPFHQPVDKKKVKNYYEIVENPVDFATIENRAKEHLYHSRQDFLSEFQLMHENSMKYNGIDSKYTEKSAEIQAAAESLIAEQSEQIGILECAIARARQNALEAFETDSITTSRDGLGSISRPPSSLAEAPDNEDDFESEQDIESEEEHERQNVDMPSTSAYASASASAPEEVMFDDNYDPAQFLIESLNRAGPSNATANVSPPPLQEDANDASETSQTAPNPIIESEPEPELQVQTQAEPEPEPELATQPQEAASKDAEEEDDGDLWF